MCECDEGWIFGECRSRYANKTYFERIAVNCWKRKMTIMLFWGLLDHSSKVRNYTLALLPPQFSSPGAM